MQGFLIEVGDGLGGRVVENGRFGGHRTQRDKGGAGGVWQMGKGKVEYFLQGVGEGRVFEPFGDQGQPFGRVTHGGKGVVAELFEEFVASPFFSEEASDEGEAERQAAKRIA